MEAIVRITFVVILTAAITTPFALVQATVLDLSGESSGGDTSGNFLPSAPPPDFPGTGPMFENRPVIPRNNDNDNNFQSPPQQQPSRSQTIDVNDLDLCDKLAELSNEELTRLIDSWSLDEVITAVDKTMGCVDDLMGGLGR